MVPLYIYVTADTSIYVTAIRYPHSFHPRNLLASYFSYPGARKRQIREDTMQPNGVIFLNLLLLVSSACSDGFVQNQQNQQRKETICRWEKKDNGQERAQKIMYNQQSRQREAMRYQIIAAEACEPLARRMEEVSSSLENQNFVWSFDILTTYCRQQLLAGLP